MKQYHVLSVMTWKVQATDAQAAADAIHALVPLRLTTRDHEVLLIECNDVVVANEMYGEHDTPQQDQGWGGP